MQSLALFERIPPMTNGFPVMTSSCHCMDYASIPHPHPPPTHPLPTQAYTMFVPKFEKRLGIFDEKNNPFSTEIADCEAQ